MTSYAGRSITRASLFSAEVRCSILLLNGSDEKVQCVHPNLVDAIDIREVEDHVTLHVDHCLDAANGELRLRNECASKRQGAVTLLLDHVDLQHDAMRASARWRTSGCVEVVRFAKMAHRRLASPTKRTTVVGVSPDVTDLIAVG
jgi:hypothetical protein